MCDTPRNIVLNTFGSLGDLHPYLAVGQGLAARGHRITVATHETYRDKVTSAGLLFAPVRPDPSQWGDPAAIMQKAMDLRHGTEFVVKKLALPFLKQSYDDLWEATDGADLLVTHPIAYAGPIVAEKRGLPWASVALAPISFFSAYDPPALPPLPQFAWLKPLGPGINGALLRLIQRTVRGWMAPVQALRREVGLPPFTRDPLFAGQFSPFLSLALFSPVLADRQPDWPANSSLTGFPFFDETQQPLSPELSAFLTAGPAPLVFTLGSSAVLDAGRFYADSASAAQSLGQRAVLLVGRDPRNVPPGLPDAVLAVEYVSFSQIFPRASVIVHQGGIGTTAQAMRAGKPMLVMPYSHDQPDNADRVRRLGIARVLSRGNYSAKTAGRELHVLLTDINYARRAAEVGQAVRSEEGISAVCGALEEIRQDLAQGVS